MSPAWGSDEELGGVGRGGDWVGEEEGIHGEGEVSGTKSMRISGGV